MSFVISSQGAIRPGVRRPNVHATAAPRGEARMRGPANPLLYPCPPKDEGGCGARRYERCFRDLYRGTTAEFRDYLTVTHPVRITLTARRAKENN